MEKIVQIVPAPDGIWAKFADGGDGETGINKVILFALIEDKEYGDRFIKPMTMSTDGMVEYPEEYSNFVEYTGLWKDAT